jgi:hypothetical protein
VGGKWRECSAGVLGSSLNTLCFSLFRQKQSAPCTLTGLARCAPRAARGRRRGPCPARAKPSLPGPRGRSARPRRAAAGWAPRPRVSARSRVAGFFHACVEKFAPTRTDGGGWLGAVRTASHLVVGNFCPLRGTQASLLRIPVPDQQPDRRAGWAGPSTPPSFGCGETG